MNTIPVNRQNDEFAALESEVLGLTLDRLAKPGQNKWRARAWRIYARHVYSQHIAPFQHAFTDSAIASRLDRLGVPLFRDGKGWTRDRVAGIRAEVE